MPKLPELKAKDTKALNLLILNTLRKIGNTDDAATLLPVRLHHIGAAMFVPLNQYHAPLSLGRWQGSYTRAVHTLGLRIPSCALADVPLAPHERAPSGHFYYCIRPAEPIIKAYERALAAAEPAADAECHITDLITRPRIKTA